MVERRNIGLKIVVGIVAFDLLILKLGLDAAEQVSDYQELTWALRLVAVFAFVILAGMLVQLEIRNREDRRLYRAAERRMDALRRGEDASAIEPLDESTWHTVRQSWITTWPLLGMLGLTIAIWWIASLLTHPPHLQPVRHGSAPSAQGLSLP
jgi:hypothetical protein